MKVKREKKPKTEKTIPFARIIKGVFKGQQAVILRDYGFHARLHIPGMVMNLPEAFYNKLV